MIETPPIVHRCRRGPRCPDRDRLDDGQILGGPIPTEDGLCPACQRHVIDAVTELPTDYVELDMELGKGGTAGGPLVSGTRELPVPIRLNIEAMQAEIVHEAVCWAESVAEVLRVTWDTQDTAHTLAGAQLQRATDLLVASLPVLLALHDVIHLGWDTYGHPAATERDGLAGAIVLLDLHWRARATLGRTRWVERLRTACDECGRTALEHPDGTDMVTCAACKSWWTWDEYLEWSDPLMAGAAA